MSTIAMAKSALLPAAIAATLLSPFGVAAHALRHKRDHVEAVIDAISRGQDDPCHQQTDALRLCMSSSGDDASVECAHCMINGLDFTKPLTCQELKDDAYCPGVAECYGMKCKDDCRAEYYAGLNCAISQQCSDVSCSPPGVQAAENKVAKVNVAKGPSRMAGVNLGGEASMKLAKSAKAASKEGNQRSGTPEAKNVYGDPLKPCSQDGMAKTGYDRSGQCVDLEGDTGSHHICIDLSSASSNGKDFCQVTGQDDWCAENMPCHEDDAKQCPVKRWCVCQWAFEGYLRSAGGCGAIQEIECDAVNIKAVEAYEADEAKHGEALKCLRDRCKLGEKRGDQEGVVAETQ